MQETMRYLGFDIGYGWWTPAASKAKRLMDAKVRHEDLENVLNDVRSFIGACNFYHRHIKNLTYSSAILTDLIQKSTTWHCGLMSNGRLRSSRTKWLTLNALACLRHKVKIYW